jgi:HEAT repeat protein
MAGAPAGELPALFEAMAGSDDPSVLNLLPEIFLVRDRKTGELAMPALRRTSERVRPYLAGLLRDGDLVSAATAAWLMERLDIAPKPGDAVYLLYCAAGGDVRNLDDHRDDASREFLKELHRADSSHRLRGGVWLTLMQRDPDREAPFSVANLVRDYIEKLNSTNGEARMEAAQMLSQLGTNAAPAVPALIRALADRTEIFFHGVAFGNYFRLKTPASAAAQALAEIGDAAVTPLLALWDDPSASNELHHAAARGIALFHDPRCTDAQFQILARDRRLDVRLDAMQSLVITDPKAAVRPVLAAAANTGDAYFTGAAMTALRNAGPAIWPQLSAALYDEDSTVVEMAMKLISESRDAGAFDSVQRLARSMFPAVRSEVAKYFGRLGDPRGTDDLIVMLDDRSTIVQWSACEALIKIGRPAAEKLIAQLPAAVSETRVRIAMILRSATGENFGPDPAAWQAWLKK